MSAEVWTQVPGHNGRHEVSSEGRVRTTADVTGGSGVMSFVWLLLLLAVAVALYKADVVNTVANLVAVALCSIPAAWVLRWVVGELRLEAECRLYAAQDARQVRRVAAIIQPAITTRVPLAIEAARPVTPLVIEAETRRMAG